jgi:hypothetical protein
VSELLVIQETLSSIETSLKYIDYWDAVQKDSSLEYYVHNLKKSNQNLNVSCWRLKFKIDPLWSTYTVLGHYLQHPLVSISQFNTNEPIDFSNDKAIILFIGYHDKEPSLEDAKREFDLVKPELIVSPEPLLIGSQIGGPFFLSQLTVSKFGFE